MKRLARRATVLPVIAKSDLLTISQRKRIREEVRQDLLAADLGNRFTLFNQLSALEDDFDGECSVSNDQIDEYSDDDSGIEGGSVNHATLAEVLPAFCFAPEFPESFESQGQIESTKKDGDASPYKARPYAQLGREYSWGRIDALDSRHSDNCMLYGAMVSKGFASVSRDDHCRSSHPLTKTFLS